MDKIIGYFSAATSTFVSSVSSKIAYIFPFGFFLNTFTKTKTRRGKIYRNFITALYYGFWGFQIASIIGLFFDSAND